MAWSNIFCQIIGSTGPVIGEGLLSGWQTSIELEGFDWGMRVEQTHEPDLGMLGALSRAAETAAPVRPIKYEVATKQLTLRKRFDIASSDIHMLMDSKLPILSVSITVLHITPSGQTFHKPGFVILATDCKIESADVHMAKAGDKGVEVKETIVVSYEGIMITYLRTLPGVDGREPVPMPPFVYTKPGPVAPAPKIPGLG
jgi:type VI protein secretion system component Hcp